MFQTRDRLQDRPLHILWQTGGYAVRIHGGIVQAFRLQEDIMAVLAGEPDDLVLDRGTITRPAPSDLARIDGRAVDVLPDDRMGRLGRAGHSAFDLPVHQARRHRAERLRLIVAGIGAQPVPVDGPSVQSRRSARLKAAKRQAQPAQASAPARPTAPLPSAGRRLPVAYMDDPAQERPGRQHHRAAANALTAGTDDRRDAPVAIRFKVFDRGGQQREVWCVFQQHAYRLPVKGAIRLRARAAYRWALAAVQQLEVDSGSIGGPPHHPVQRVDLPHQMAFADPADRRVARHLANRSQ